MLYRLKIKPGNPVLALFVGDEDGIITGGVVADSDEEAKEAHTALFGNDDDEVVEVSLATAEEVDAALSVNPNQEVLIAGAEDPKEGKWGLLKDYRPAE